MRFEPPDDDAYGRVTNPERFQVVVDAAVALIDELARTYDVAPSEGIAAVDFPKWHDPTLKTVRFIPEEGVPILVMITELPGVVIRFGEWSRYNAFPGCGCDACDERPDDVIDELNDQVAAAVAGNYREVLTKRSLGWSLAFPAGGRRASESRLRRGEWKQYGGPGVHQWPAWTERRT